MIVKDVYERIKDLEKDRSEFVKIQESCLGHMTETSDELNEGKHTKIYGALEDGAKLHIQLRHLASKTIENIDGEIRRLKKIIENLQVSID